MPRVPYTTEPGSNVTPMVGQIDPTTLAMAAGMMYSEGKLFEPKEMNMDTEDAPGQGDMMFHVGVLKKKIETFSALHNEMLDTFRSIEDIVKEGSNPSASSRFRSSSSRNPDSGD